MKWKIIRGAPRHLECAGLAGAIQDRLRGGVGVRTRVALALLAALACAPGQAQETNQQGLVREIKAAIAGGCRERGQVRGIPAERVEAICGCMSRVLDKNVSDATWLEAHSRGAEGREADIFGQIVQPLMPEVDACARERLGQGPVK